MRHSRFRSPVGCLPFARFLSCLAIAVAVGGSPSARAQWITQTNALKAGWNSVYLQVDASYTNAHSLLIANPNLQEAWMWTADLPPGLSLATPPDPTSSSRWLKWTRLDGPNSALQTLPGNAALLLKVADGVAPFNWTVKGQPVQPVYRWTLTGLNFVGFPTAVPAPSFEAFLGPDAQALDWKQSAEIFRYVGGNLGTTNPLSLPPNQQRLIPVARDQAYWIRAGEPTNQVYNHYFGPFQVTGIGSTGLRFGDRLGQAKLYLKNMTKSNLTVTLREVASETSPTGVVPSLLPLMVRGPLVTTNLSFSYSDLTAGPSSWALTPFGQPGSEAEIILGVDRSQMGPTPGAAFAGVLRFTDSMGLIRVEAGVSATTVSRTGLWVGNAVVTNVSQYLKAYTKATNVTQFHQRLNDLNRTIGSTSLPVAYGADGHRYELDTNTGRILVFDGPELSKGQYLQDSPQPLVNPSEVARPFPLRLIVHNNGSTSRLMQRAYLGRNASSNDVVAARQGALLASDLANARRLSAVHLPTADGNDNDGGPWVLAGAMQQNSSLATTVDIRYDHRGSNPFIHAYHPDHDNLDAGFETLLPSGAESYDLRRVMTLTFVTPGNDFDSRARSGTTLEGSYRETMSFRTNLNSGGALKQFDVVGSFSLTRIVNTATYAP